MNFTVPASIANITCSVTLVEVSHFEDQKMTLWNIQEKKYTSSGCYVEHQIEKMLSGQSIKANAIWLA